ncbi:CoA transferase [Limnohabitans sp.]|uniref:CaiB/BaiF CoA transferase family protein n=1 Tax=Limnohabitans sp. TaxID=1907725 RepID=UPI00334145CB
MNTNAGALAGIRVLDLSRVLAGPWCGMLLGDMGADVIKVEAPSGGDDTRTWGPPFIGDQSAYYLGCNRNKRGISIDFSSDKGKLLLQKLVQRSDVVIDNFKAETMARWGLDDDWYQIHAPEVVRCSITGYGTFGPKAELPGYDFVLQAESGLMSITGVADGVPVKHGIAMVDIATGMMAANAIQAGLIARFRTGLGQRVEVCLHDTALAMLVNVGNSHLATGKDAIRYGNGHPTIVPYTTFATADGLIAIAVGNDSQFAKFSDLLGRVDWIDDVRFSSNPARIAHRALIETMIAEEILHWHCDELILALRSKGVPSGRVNTVSQALADEHALVRGMVAQVTRAGLEFKTLGIPLQLFGTPSSIRLAPPSLGQHTREVLQDDLKLTDSEIADLYSLGVVAG